MHATIAGPLFEAQEPPGGGAGDGDGDGAGVGGRRQERLRARPRARRFAIAGARAPVVRAARRQGGGDGVTSSALPVSANLRARHDLRERDVEADLHLVGDGTDGALRVGAADRDRRRRRGDAFVVDRGDERRCAEIGLRQHFERGGDERAGVGAIFRSGAPVVPLPTASAIERDGCLAVRAGRHAAAREDFRLEPAVARHLEACMTAAGRRWCRRSRPSARTGCCDVLELGALRRLDRTRGA